METEALRRSKPRNWGLQRRTGPDHTRFWRVLMDLNIPDWLADSSSVSQTGSLCCLATIPDEWRQLRFPAVTDTEQLWTGSRVSFSRLLRTEGSPAAIRQTSADRDARRKRREKRKRSSSQLNVAPCGSALYSRRERPALVASSDVSRHRRRSGRRGGNIGHRGRGRGGRGLQ